MAPIPSKLAKISLLLTTAVAATALTAGIAAAASPPTAVTGPASAVAPSAATVSGDINPDGLSTTWFFEYGTTTSYGLRSAATTTGAGTGAQSVAVRLTGLTPGTTYHDRLVAESSAGATYGADATLRTPAEPPVVGSETASPVHDTSARIVADIDPKALATSWYVRYGTTSSYGSSTPARAAGSSPTTIAAAADIGGLTAHTTYYFDVVATNAAGTTIGSGQVFSTPGAAIIASESAANLTPTTATLTGSIDPDGHPTTWYFQYGPTAHYGARTAAGHLGAVMTTRPVSAAISGLQANTTYDFRLVAVSADGTVIGGGDTFTTPGPTLSSSSSSVDFGRPVMLSGSVPDGAANEAVSLYAQPTGTPSFVELATLLTGSGGSWAYSTTPSIGTVYKVLWKNETSPLVTVAVSPSVTLRERAGGRFVTHVAAARSFAGAVARLQRLTRNGWRTIASTKLNRDSSAALRPALPSGVSHLRIWLTPFQAGAGYVGAYSAARRYTA